MSVSPPTWLPPLDGAEESSRLCRICREDGRDLELRHPCKCSGSIEYVHQECLVQWLAFTGRTYCELCKKPFNFRKIYAENTPTSLPFYLYSGRLLARLFAYIVRYTRTVFALHLWLVVVPWKVRLVWRALFWFADGGWARDHLFRPAGPAGAASSGGMASHTGATTCQPGSAACPVGVSPARPTMMPSIVVTLFNWISAFYRMLALAMSTPASHILAASTPGASGQTAGAGQPIKQPGSLLSDVRLLKSPTPSPVFNQAIIDVFEGQIISLLILVSFVLVFLIREWVVQQMPAADVAMAAFARDDHALDPAMEVEDDDLDGDGIIHDNALPGLVDSGDEAWETEDELEYDDDDGQEGDDQADEHETGRLKASDAFGGLREAEGVTPEFGPFPRDHYVEPVAAPTEGRSETEAGLPPRTGDAPVDEDAVDGASSGESAGDTPAESSGLGSTLDTRSEDASAEQEPLAEPPSTQGDVVAEDPQPDQEQTPGQFPDHADLFDLDTDSDDSQGDNDTDNSDESDEDDDDVLEDPAPPQPVALPQNGRDGADENWPAVNAAIQAADADDLDEWDGVFELIGLEGPLTGLFQNASFAIVLITLVIVAAVWFPYVSGKLVLLLFGGSSPLVFLRLPFEMVATVTDIVLDGSMVVVGFTGFCLLRLCRYVFGSLVPLAADGSGYSAMLDRLTASSQAVFLTSTNKLLDVAGIVAMDSDYLVLSVNSHAALRAMRGNVGGIFRAMVSASCQVYGKSSVPTVTDLLNLPSLTASLLVRSSITLGQSIYREGSSLLADIHTMFLWTSKRPPSLLTTGFRTNLDTSDRSLVFWSASDRVMAILAGYAAFFAVGAVYLYRAERETGSTASNILGIERIVFQAVRQAAGVVKVMVIISIEMIVFPLYCGILLDLALLPVFDGATVASRIVSAINHPWFALFVHWFIGTSYMFHFALFVSMCRKIVRKGVLHFIRDPDDPSNHPIKDVLERSVTTQLRKILFSAVVYAGLVLACLGGVVWLLAAGPYPVLPLRPGRVHELIETVFDLVVFGFFTPIVLDKFQPNDVVRQMYGWWFRTAAHHLRLSSFLLGAAPTSIADRRPSRPWLPWKPSVRTPYTGGKFMFAPSSDHVRLRKGEPVFKGRKAFRLCQSKDKYESVFIPDHFRARIAGFVTLLWLFSVGAGLAVSVLPLLVGRLMVAAIPGRGPGAMCDVYAFVAGGYVVGAVGYAGLWLSRNWEDRVSTVTWPGQMRVQVDTIVSFFRTVGSIVYVYGFIGGLIPIVGATLFEIYVIMPLHSLFLQPDELYTIHLIHSWTLGMLYLRLLYEADPAMQAIFQDGWLRPRVKMATKELIAPAVYQLSIMIAIPNIAAYIIDDLIFEPAPPDIRQSLFRFLYPFSAVLVIAFKVTMVIRYYSKHWQNSVIDELYVVKEELLDYEDSHEEPARPTVEASG